MIRLMTVFGTRPEVIKMAPVVKEFEKYPDRFDCRVCVTAQHRQMIDPLLNLFGIKPDYDLNLMQEDQSLEHITIAVLTGLGKIIDNEKPNFLLVQGDTTTGMAGSLAAFYRKMKIGHVEAGLRTGNKYHPYPEEVNRRIIDSMSDLFFAHSEEAKQNLVSEGIDESKIEVTGNTVIDALLDVASRFFEPAGSVLERMPWDGKRTILVTAHRRENFGEPLRNICIAIRELAYHYSPDLYFVYPVHLNPNVQKTVRPILGNMENVLLTEPLDYLSFVQLMKRSYFILTDSGGLQEEAPSLGKPVLVLRETTERPEGVAAGAVEVVGTEPKKIIEKATELLENQEKYQKMASAINPYGDGLASQRIARRLLKEVRGNG